MHAAGNSRPNNTKIHLNVPNENVSFSNVSYEDIREQPKVTQWCRFFYETVIDRMP